MPSGLCGLPEGAELGGGDPETRMRGRYLTSLNLMENLPGGGWPPLAWFLLLEGLASVDTLCATHLLRQRALDLSLLTGGVAWSCEGTSAALLARPGQPLSVALLPAWPWMDRVLRLVQLRPRVTEPAEGLLLLLFRFCHLVGFFQRLLFKLQFLSGVLC